MFVKLVMLSAVTSPVPAPIKSLISFSVMFSFKLGTLPFDKIAGNPVSEIFNVFAFISSTCVVVIPTFNVLAFISSDCSVVIVFVSPAKASLEVEPTCKNPLDVTFAKLPFLVSVKVPDE